MKARAKNKLRARRNASQKVNHLRGAEHRAVIVARRASSAVRQQSVPVAQPRVSVEGLFDALSPETQITIIFQVKEQFGFDIR